MDYDANDVQDQNLNLVGEGSSKVSPVLHSYPLPKFDFGENLQEHLGFDSLVENEVFLGITSQEDNQWIEEYSSAPESRHQNVWSEATSSESVEMLLKSVGQEEKVLEETMVESTDPNMNQCDVNDPDELQETQETQILDSVVVGHEYGKSFGEEKVDKICDDANEEGSNLETESFVNELQEDPSVSIVESGNASVEEFQENTQEVLETPNENASELTKNHDHIDETHDDANEEGSNLESEPFDNKLQDLSVSKVESGIEGSLQNVDTSVEEKPQEVVETHHENASYVSETFHSDEREHTDKKCDDANQECSDLGNELQEDVFVSNIEHENAGFSQNVDASDISKKFDSSENEIIDKICDDENQEGRNLANESNANEVEEDLSVFKVEHENAESLHNVDESVENFQENENTGYDLKNSDNELRETQPLDPDTELQETQPLDPDTELQETQPLDPDTELQETQPLDPDTELQETQPLDPDTESMDQDSTFDERGNSRLPLDSKDMDMDVVGVPDGEKNVEPYSSENNAPDIDTVDSNQSTPVKISGLGQVDDETQSSEPDVLMDQDSTFSERGDSRLHLDSKDMEMDVDKAPESQKNVEMSSSIVIPQGSESSIAVTTDAVAVVESSKTSSHETLQAGIVNEDQPRSPILGVSLLHDNNESKVEVEEQEHFQKETPQVDSTVQVVKKDAVSDSAEKDAGDCDLSVVNCNVTPSEQTTSPIPCDSSKEANNAKTGDLLDLKELMAKEDGVKGEGGSASLDKFQVFSFSETKSIDLEPSQSEKDTGTIENTPLLKITNEETGLQSVSSTSKKEEKSFTFEVTEQTGIQNLDLSKVSTVSSSGTLLDTNIPRENSLVTPQKPSVTPSESGAKKKSERKPRRKSVGKETAKKVNNNSKETTPTRLSKTEKSPPFITTPDLNNLTLFQQSFTDNQQVQLRAQILVYGSLISGTSPEEPHMIAAFGQSDSGRKAWESAWNACKERVHFQVSQINNNPNTPLQSRPINKDPNQETKINSTKNKIPTTPTTTNPILSPMFPISSPLWNMSTPQNQLQSNQTPRNPLFDYRQNLSPLHSFQSQRPNPYGQWVASSPVPAFSPRFSSLPITESVKLTTVKESGGPATSITPLQHTTTPLVLSGQPLTDSKTRKRKKAADNSMSVITTHSLTPVAFSTPVSITPKTNPFLSALSTPPTHGQPKHVDQNMEETVTKDDTVTKIEEAKVQATEAAVHAANAVTHCEHIWSQLERQKNSGLISDDEAKLASSAVSIAAASSVAKVAAFAAKIASNVAEQARLMADEVIISSSKIASQPLNSDNSTSVISVAREAARKRVEAALTASKHAENLDAIVKAAELAAEAVSQAGKIVAVGNPLTIKELVEAGPDGYWKTPQAAKNIQGYFGNEEKVGAGSSDKKTDSGKDKSVERAREGHDLLKNVGAVPELVIGQSHTSDADMDMTQSTSHSWKDNDIKEGCLVEVYKDDNKNKGAWFAANVLTVKDGKAFVCYTEIQSNEGSGNLKEWVPLEVEGSEAPKIRIAHPMTTLRLEGNKKRGRTVFSDYSWCCGDQVDVWVHDSWQEAIVVETNKIDLTSLTVQFPAQGKTSVVRSWHVRPSLVWKDGKWIDWSSMKPSHSSQGDTPQEKRQKFDKEKEKSIDLETMKHQESRIPLPTFSTHNISFDVGKTSIDDKKQKPRGPMRSGLHKEKSRVVFGVPQPSKKQKFIDMSKHYVADHQTNKNNNNNNPPSSLGKKFSINDEKEKQVAEVKSKMPKFRKPPVPVLSQREKSKSSVSDKNVKDSVRADEKVPRQQKEMGVGSLSHDVALNTPKKGSTSKGVSERLNNKRKIPSGNGKASKVEVNESLTSEAEPRRSNRKIQPTSRLLEGLQSSLSLSKMPTVSHSSQRSNIPKGSPRPG